MLLSFLFFAKRLISIELRESKRPGGRRRFFSLSRDATVSITRSSIRANYLDARLSMEQAIVLRGSDSGIVQPHLGDGSSLQRVTSVLSKRSGVPQRAFLPIGLRIARDAMHRGAISDSIVVTGPRSNARTIRRGAMPRVNSTVYEDERVGNARAFIRTDEPRPKTHRGA